MKFTSHLHKNVKYSSLSWRDSIVTRGVQFAIRRVSLAQRIELTKRTRELLLRHEFLRSGDMSDQIEAALKELFVRRLYLEWGLAEITGLLIDGQPVTVELLIEKGPEALSDEIAAAIRDSCNLAEEERKNF